MKKLIPFATIVMIIALLAITMPVAAEWEEPAYIRVRDAEIDFYVGKPFFMQHGWIQVATDGAIGIFGFSLDIDGVPQKESFKLFTAEGVDPDILSRIWVYNFPEGLQEGTHTFTGHWFAPCQYAVDELDYAGPCATPNAKVETTTKTLTINFVPGP